MCIIDIWSKYVVTTVDVNPEVFKGIHKVYTKFEGGTDGDKYCANMDWFRFYDPAITNPLEEDGPVYYYKGCDITSSASSNFTRALEIAQKADVVIFAGGTDLSVSDESHDRTSLDLPGDQQKLLEAIYAVNPNVVLLLQTCSSMTIGWAQQKVPAIVEAWYDGQAQGQAIADVLYGDFNPSGRLTSTWYSSLSALPSTMLNYDIRKSGYTYMYHKDTPLYPFGHGLSYTTFDYSGFSLSTDRLPKGGELTATAMVTNTGSRAGAEVVQLYARCHSSIERPQLQLVGFARVELEPGETATVTIPLRHDQLAYFNTATQTFDVEEGTVDLMLAASSADIRLRESITTEGGVVKLTHRSDQTAIDEIMADTPAGDDRIYNLAGQYVGTSLSKLSPGFYISGGKKVLKK